VEKLTPYERFNRLLSFLRDPQAYPHPGITLDHLVRIKKGILRALRLAEFRQEALEVMEAGIFRQGLLQGNRRTPDIAMDNLEEFVLEVAAAFHLAKQQLSGSLFTYYVDSEGQPQVIDHDLIMAHDDMMEAFEKFGEIVHDPPPPVIKGNNLIRPDKIERIRRELNSLLSEAINKIKEETSYDLVIELILIFLRHVPQANNNLIASHIYKFINARQDSSLRGVILPAMNTGALFSKVKTERKRLTSTIQ
jgi:hypothetical protein